HHDPAQMRMAEKAYAEQIEDFAFEEIRRRPDRSDGFHGRVIAFQPDLQTYPLLPLHRKKVVGQFKAWLARVEIGAGYVREKVGELLRLQLGQGFADGFARDVDRKLVAIEFCTLNDSGIPGQQGSQYRARFELVEVGDGWRQGHQLSLLSVLFQSSAPFFHI